MHTHKELKKSIEHNCLRSVYMVEYASCPNNLTQTTTFHCCVVKDVEILVEAIQRGLLVIA